MKSPLTSSFDVSEALLWKKQWAVHLHNFCVLPFLLQSSTLFFIWSSVYQARVLVYLFLMGKLFIILIAFLWTFPSSKLYIFCGGRGQSSHNIRDTGPSWVMQLQNGTLFSIPFLKITSVHLALISFELLHLRILNPEIVFASWVATISLEPMIIHVKLGPPFSTSPININFLSLNFSQLLYFPDKAEVLRLP